MTAKNPRRVHVSLRASAKEANPQLPHRTRHLTGGASYTATFRSSEPADHHRLMAIVKQVAPANEVIANRVFKELSTYEAGLLSWIERSPTNAAWFAHDPAGAVAAAGLGIPKPLLHDLKALSAALAGKQKGAK